MPCRTSNVTTEATTPSRIAAASDPSDKPGENADQAAGRQRAEKPAQRAAQHAAEDEQPEDDKRIEPGRYNRAVPAFANAAGSGAGSFSPSMTRIIRSMPAEMPPAKSPLLNFGVMSSSMMRLVVTSVSAPSRP